MTKLGEALGPEHLPETVPPDMHPVLRHILEREQAGSVRGERDDSRVIALTVEGGGHRGSISAGMLVGMEAMGLMDSVDVIYGVSSGSLNGSYAATGQAALGATNYEETANKGFANKWRLLRGRPVIDFDRLFVRIMQERKPYDERGFEDGPEFRAIAVDLAEESVEVLQNFDGIEDMSQAVRVSCAIPVLSAPATFRGRAYADGGLLDPLPYDTALRDGATDVLALRTRPADYRKSEHLPVSVSEALYRLPAGEEVARLIARQPRLYNDYINRLEALSAGPSSVKQIVPAEGTANIGRTEHSVDKVRAGLMAGMAAVARAFGAPQAELFWQPRPYVVKDHPTS
jgi:predicted patatin/cPLA2 family phospholipase